MKRLLVTCLAWFCVTLSLSAQAQNYSDIWWNPAESGWGLTIADHQSDLFAVWFTYRQDGKPTWFVIPGGTLSSDRLHFQGDVYATTGPSYAANPFDPSRVTVTKAGTATIDFTPAGTGTFTYNVNGVTQSKPIQRQPFGNAAPAWGSDVTDIWYNPAESGWGLTLAQHGSDVFGVWFTYDTDGQPLWVVLPGVTFDGPDKFTGNLYTTTGPSFAGPFDPSKVVVTPQGSATLTVNREGDLDLNCSGSQKAAFASTLRGVTGTDTVCQQIFGDMPGEPAPTPTSADLGTQITGPVTESMIALQTLAEVAITSPWVSAYATDLGAAVTAAEAAIASRIATLPKSSTPVRLKNQTDASMAMGYMIATHMDSFAGIPPGNSVSVPVSNQSGPASVTMEVTSSTGADGTLHVTDTVVKSIRAELNGKAGAYAENSKLEGEGGFCPGPDGRLHFKLHTKVVIQVVNDRQVTGGMREYLIDGTAHVNDAAFADHVDFDMRVQGSQQDPDTHNTYVDAVFRGAVDGAWDGSTNRSVSYTTGKWTRKGSTTSIQEARSIANELADRALEVMTGFLAHAQDLWRDGKCVEIVTDAPNYVAQSSTTPIVARVQTKHGGAEIHVPVDGSLTSGAVSLAPARIAVSPGTFTYVAPDKNNLPATLTFKTTSRRGMASLDVAILTVMKEGYVVDWSDGAGNHVYGTICNGLDNPFTLNFNSGGQITGTFAFAPASATAGTVHLSGATVGGAVTYSGEGTYTVIDPPALRYGFSSHTATYPGPSGPVTINVPPPSGELPLRKSNTC